MIRPVTATALAVATLTACGAAPAEFATASWQRCRSEARVHAASQAPALPPGLPHIAAPVREAAFLQPCLAPVPR